MVRCGVSKILEMLVGTLLVVSAGLASMGVEKIKGGDDVSSSSNSNDSTGEGSLLSTTDCIGFGVRGVDSE